jgi:hypothetical protein
MAPSGETASHVSTNAPRHWPRVALATWARDNAVAKAAANRLFLAAALSEALGSSAVKAFHRTLVYEDGIVELPIVVEDGGQRCAVFTYAVGDAAAAAHYSGVRALLRQRESMAAYYYAGGPLAPAPPASPLRPLDTPHFSLPGKEREAAAYALWWPTPEDPRLSASPALPHLDRVFEGLDGIASYLFSAFVNDLRLDGAATPGTRQIYGLPAQPFMLPLDGPGEWGAYLSASDAEGLWLACDVEATPAPRRNLFLALQAGLATWFRAACAAQGVSPRAEEKGRALEWWRRTRAEALRMEAEGGEGVRVGSIVEARNARYRLVGATTAADRAARVQPGASDALIDFARAQLDIAVARVQRSKGEQGVNLHPFLAVQKGATIRERVFFQFDEPEAIATCPEALAEEGDVNRAVLVCDGVLREQGERVDALRVRAQDRGEPRSHVYAQRYRKEPFALLRDWVGFGTGESLFPAPGAVPAAVGEPDPGVRDYAEQCLRDTVKALTVVDPSAAHRYHEGEPLFLPKLLLRVGDGLFTHKFAMGSRAWARGACGSAIAESPSASLAAFVYDDVASVDGRSARSLRFHVQARGTPAAFVFAQGYEAPREGIAFAFRGELTLVGSAPGLFPTAGGTAPSAARAPAPGSAPAPARAPAPASATVTSEVERRRLELTRAASQTVVPEYRSLQGRVAASVREVDLAAQLRFAAVSCEWDDAGLRARMKDGSLVAVEWSALREIRARRLPPDPPWNGALIVDFVPAIIDAEHSPIRLLPMTAMNFRGLPGPPATSRRESIRRFITHVASRSPQAVVEPQTRPFVEQGKDGPGFGSIGQFSEYDARYG